MEDIKVRNREYQHKWYLANKETHNKRMAANKQKLKVWFNNLKSKSCAECKISYPPYIMDFDHRPGEVKLFNLCQSYLLYGKERILAEMAKCDLVCANCHRTRTYLRRIDL